MVTFTNIHKGHEVWQDGVFLFWVAGSKRNAKKELKIHQAKNVTTAATLEDLADKLRTA